MNATKKSIGRTIPIKVSAVRQLCEFTLARYERYRSECSDAMEHRLVYQECRGEFLAMEKLFIGDREVIDLIADYFDSLNRLYSDEFHLSALPPASSGEGRTAREAVL